MEIEQLMTDKSFYTLIRRFRYQYKKFNALRELDGEFYDKHLREAYRNSKKELEDTTNRMVLMVLGGFINPSNTSLEFSQDVDLYGDWGGRHCSPRCSNQSYQVSVDNKAYYDFVQELMRFYYER